MQVGPTKDAIEGSNIMFKDENEAAQKAKKKSSALEMFKVKSKKDVEEDKFRRSATMKDNRTAMERYIDKYWLLNVERMEKAEEREFTVAEIDQIVHNMLHSLFLMAEDDEADKFYVHKRQYMLHH